MQQLATILVILLGLSLHCNQIYCFYYRSIVVRNNDINLKHKILTSFSDSRIILSNRNNNHLRSSFTNGIASSNSSQITSSSSSEEEESTRRFSKYNVLANVIFNVLTKLISDSDLAAVITKTLVVALAVFMVLSVFGTLGVDTKPLLSFLGIGGITLGLSFKDFLSDYYAGIILMLLRPIGRGAIVNIGGNRGKVVALTARYLRLYNKDDKTLILLPMSYVYKNIIKIERNN